MPGMYFHFLDHIFGNIKDFNLMECICLLFFCSFWFLVLSFNVNMQAMQ